MSKPFGKKKAKVYRVVGDLPSSARTSLAHPSVTLAEIFKIANCHFGDDLFARVQLRAKGLQPVSNRETGENGLWRLVKKKS